VADEHQPLLALSPDEWFVGRRREIDQVYQLGLEAAGARRHSTLLVGRRGIGKSEILRRSYNRLFWNQTRVVPIYLTLTKETQDVVAFARQWLATFLRQWIGFRRKDAALVDDEAMPFSRVVRLAHRAGQPALVQLIDNFEESLRDRDWVCLLRSSVAAPLTVARMSREPVFTIVDEFQRVGRLSLEGTPMPLSGLFEFILQGHEAPHLLAGSSLRVIERILGSRLLGRHVERLNIEPLRERSSLRLWESLCRRLGVACRLDLGLEFVEQFEGVPLYIQALVRAAAQQGVGLTSLRNIQMVYAHDLLHGEIGAVWTTLFEEAVPDAGDRRPALDLLRHLCEDSDLRPLPWRHLAGVTGLEMAALQRLAEHLERGGFLEIGHSQVFPIADRVLRDWVRLAARREETGGDVSTLRQELVRERLLWTAHLRQERGHRHIGRKVEALLAQWDNQSVAPVLFNWPAFQRVHGTRLFQEIADLIDGHPATLTLPQIVGVTPSTGAKGQAESGAPTLLAFGFEEGRYAPGHECLAVVQMHRGREPVSATQAEEFLALAERHVASTGIERVQRWLIARGGFTEEAVEVLSRAECWTSDFTQLQLMMRQFGVHTEEAFLGQTTTLGFGETLTMGEYALAIPMAPDTELVAASAIDQIATQAGFGESARGQIKMAIIEACINAREHSGELAAISLKIRPGDTHLEIAVENPGQVFDPEAVAEPVLEEKMGRGRSLRDKRGWGLKLMRNLMDDVIFEPSDEGTRVRLIKYRTPSEQTPPPPVIDVTEE
jgi:anti-sigma regulatory factor (Ser/Thr protein kinase)